MVFSSNFFLLVFLPFFLLAYYISPYKLKNIIALIGSLFFYAWGAPQFIFVLLGSLLLDFYTVNWIYGSSGGKRKLLLVLLLVFNIGLLSYFKYANFFIGNVNLILSFLGVKGISNWTAIVLPIGISFITFHKLTYAIDAYRSVHKPLNKFSDYVLYILMFPHQIAGPIVRFNEIADQIENRRKDINIENCLSGMFRFIIGLSKKVIISNPLGNVANTIFELHANDLSSITAWVGILAYTFQIYFDFSGYSDMAIGLAKMMGFTFPENFNLPYISKSITEFWRRWHITLGRFMRDYLYIPLGGNKVSAYRVLFNLWVVFLISGLWHGASWTFIVWGAYHGFLLVAEKLFLLKFYNRLYTPLRILFTFILVMIGWVIFRADSIHQAWQFVLKMFSFSGSIASLPILGSRFWAVLMLAAVISFYPFIFDMFKKTNILYQNSNWKRTQLLFRGISALILLFLCVCEINSSDFNPFIYYRF